jgi:hypothetical protein
MDQNGIPAKHVALTGPSSARGQSKGKVATKLIVFFAILAPHTRARAVLDPLSRAYPLKGGDAKLRG